VEKSRKQENIMDIISEVEKEQIDMNERKLKLQKRNLIEVRSRKNYDRRYPLKFKVKIRHREFENEQEKKYANL